LSPCLMQGTFRRIIANISDAVRVGCSPG
jgi:hypothetical protein